MKQGENSALTLKKNIGKKRKDWERLACKSKNFTRQTRKQSLREQSKSALSRPYFSIQPCDKWGWCKNATNGVWFRCPVYPWILVDKKEEHHELRRGGLPEVRWRRLVILKKFVAHDGQNWYVSVKTNLGSAWKKSYVLFQHFINGPDESV